MTEILTKNRNGIYHLTDDHGESAVCGSKRHSGRVLPETPHLLGGLPLKPCGHCAKQRPEAVPSIIARITAEVEAAKPTPEEQAAKLAPLLGKTITVTPKVLFSADRDTEPGAQPWETTLVGITTDDYGNTWAEVPSGYGRNGTRQIDPDAISAKN